MFGLPPCKGFYYRVIEHIKLRNTLADNIKVYSSWLWDNYQFQTKRLHNFSPFSLPKENFDQIISIQFNQRYIMSQYDRLAWVFVPTQAWAHIPWLFLETLQIQIGTSVSQPIRSESDDLMSGYVLYLMLDITTPPILYACCFWVICLDTGVQPQLNLPCVWILPMGPGALGGASQGLCCLMEVSPSCPATINSPASGVMSGEAGRTVRGTRLYHALGTSQVQVSSPDLRPGQRPGLWSHFWSSRSSFRPSRAQSSQGSRPGA